MLTSAKWVSLVACLALVPMSWWQSASTITLLLELLVWAGIVVYLIQAFSLRAYVWGAAFVAFALLLNPVAPVLWSWFLLAGNACCAVVMAASLRYLPAVPRLTIASITDAHVSNSL